ncbi:ROK family protein [Nguyenibacter vanlangensis]|uniref:ROK family protein n=3 Tax=Nguyenibacter vanlangensis TaxID=1216886 RepID=A0ABZ3D0U4_9PROT
MMWAGGLPGLPMNGFKDHIVILCADIGGSYIDFAVADGAHQLSSRRRRPTPVGSMADFASTLAELAAPYDRGLPLHVAIAGVCDPQTGHTRSANIPCVNDRPLRDALMARLGRPVVIGNDAHCFALAEAMQGAGVGHRIVFGVILGTGVGGGLVIDGRAIVGVGGLAGEWGHGPFIAESADPGAVPALPCQCGQRGCLDTIGGARGIERLYQFFTGRGSDSQAILSDWEAGMDHPRHTMAMWLDRMSAGLAGIVNVTGATIVPVGGGLANRPRLLAALDAAVTSRVLRPGTSPIVVPGYLPADSGLVGASWLTGGPR